MKKFIFFSILTFGFLTSPHAQQYGWKDISGNIPDFPFDTVYNIYGDTIIALLTDVFFIDDSEGWITTWHASNDTAAILHTTDGGQTYDVQITQFPCYAIHMLNENVGYAGGESGFVYKTTDGGENWVLHGSIANTLTSINFPPVGDTGYCTGFNGTFAKITPLGVTLLESSVNGGLYDVCFPVNKTEGKACGGDLLLTFINEVLAGNNDYPSGSYYAICMVDNNEGWAAGTKIIHTEDGVSWFDQGMVLTETLLSVYFLNNKIGWTVGSNGTIFQTSNGGIDWNVEGAELSTAILNGVHFTSPTNGYVVGNSKALFKYTEVSGVGDTKLPIEFELFPNPVSEKFELQSAEFGVDAGKVELFDLNGKKLYEEEIEKGEESIEIKVSKLQAGMYFCKITIGKRSSTKKIIKE